MKSKEQRIEEKNKRKTEKALKKKAKNEAIVEKEEKRKVKKAKRKRRHRHIRRLLLGLFAVFVVLFVMLCVEIYPTYKDICKTIYDDLASIDESTFLRAGNTEIYDSSNKLIGKIGNEKYEYVPVSKISKYITEGYVAQEDRNFYTHPGVDFKATFRAGLALIKHKGEITQGGSTITQQVIKNNILSQEKTYKRKILEILLAFRIEQRYDKAQIMEFYCNSNYYGNGCYGVEGASQYYFGKSSSDLTLAEAAILVGTSNSPNNYNPVASYDKAMEKKKQVLNSMLQEGYISNKEYKKALKEEPEIVQKTENTETESYQITYALHCATLKLMEQDGFNFQYVFNKQSEYDDYIDKYNTAYAEAYGHVRTGGYTIKTSLDSKLQKKLQKNIDSGLSNFKDKKKGIYEMQGAGVCIDNETQMVVAIVGGRKEKGSFNRGYQAKRQPGSCIKPLLDYGPALNEGAVIPSTIITDKAVEYNGYSPKNAGGGYRGDVTVREALARSINTVAVQLYDITGPEKCMNYLGKMKFSSLTAIDSDVMTVAIGGFTNGVTVENMARGYATVANGGQYSDNTCIKSIVDYTGKEVYKMSDKTTEVFNADTAYMLTDLMKGTFEEEYGTAHKAYTDEQYYAGKTGTTNDSKDAWFCGFSKYYTTTIWVGCDTPKSVYGLYGGTYPLSIWSSFMNDIHKDKAKQDFDMPDSLMITKKSLTNTYPYNTSLKTKQATAGKLPSKWDFISGILLDKCNKDAEAVEQEKIIKLITAEVEEFEKYTIDSPEDAINLKTVYTKLLEDIQTITDETTKNSLMTRATYKYDALNDEVVSRWGDVENAQKEYDEAKRNEEIALNEQTSLELANSTYISTMTGIVNWFIDKLNERTIYTENVQKLINDGELYLNYCKDFSSYSDLSYRFNKAKQRALDLPTPEDIQDDIEYPNEEDYEDDEDTEEHMEEQSSTVNNKKEDKKKNKKGEQIQE